MSVKSFVGAVDMLVHRKVKSLRSRIGAEGRYHLRSASSQTENLNGKLIAWLAHGHRAAIDHLTSSRYCELVFNQRRLAALTTQKAVEPPISILATAAVEKRIG